MLHIISSSRPHFSSLILSFAFCVCLSVQVSATQTDIVGPAGSGAFGQTVTVLPNGNIVVTDYFYDAPGPIGDVGAVHLYDGATLALISTLTGSTGSDFVGSQGIIVLSNGNYVVKSPFWDNPAGAIADVGAVTWCSQTTGCSGTVSSANSLVGGTAGDFVGSQGIIVLSNGNYVVSSQFWDNPAGAIADVGAVTWCSQTTGCSGTVSAANSLVGGTAGDFDSVGVTALTNGNYVVSSVYWDNPSPAATDAGAVTWGNGTSGTSGVVSSSNSLIGGTASDYVGGGVTALTNGNYVVRSENWDNTSPAAVDVGSVTWGNGAGGTIGLVTSANSLVGGTAFDYVGNEVTALTNGNYVVRSYIWDNPSPTLITNVGAVTWGDGAGGTVGLVTSANSLVGGTAGDFSVSGVTALTNGNYVVSSYLWDNPSPAATDAGAVTWGNGTIGTSGVVSSSNSLIGSTASDYVGGVTALTNGNYVVSSPDWDNPSPAAADAGAVTWGNGAGGTIGLVTSANSLVGSTAFDYVGGVTALTNGNYVVSSLAWDNPSPAAVNAGAVTWGNGTSGTSGTISSSNSLIGSTAFDSVGFGGVTALTNGNYVVSSRDWDNPSPVITDVGAVTWGNGTSGTSGTISSSNSLIGSTADDFDYVVVTALTNGNYVVRNYVWDNPSPVITDVGAVTWGNGTSGRSGVVSSSNSLIGSTALDVVGYDGGITALTNGNYVVNSPFWDNPVGAIADARALTFGNGAGGTSGLITNGATGGNSVVGTVANGLNTFAFDATRNRLVVARLVSNTVSILSFTTTAIADGNLSNAANWSDGVPDALRTGIIPSGRTMSISSIMYVGQIHVQCGANLTGGSSSAYIVGSVRRDFCAAAGESFTYPIGDPNNYSPLAVSNANGTGHLTASVTDTTLAGLPPPLSVSRYWSLNGSGITTDLSFTYVDADINSVETAYKVYRRFSILTTEATPSSINAATNTASVTGVSSFSDWGIGNLLAPMATPTATNTDTPTDTPTATATETFTPTETATDTPTDTPTPAETPSTSGTITYGNAIGNPVPPRFVKNVSVSSTAGSPAVGPVITGTPGTYTLTGFGAGSYTIKPTKPGGSNGAVTSNDAARVAQGVSSSVPFVSLNQKFASDASGNGTVSSNDAALIARFAAGLTGTGNVGQWKFFTANLPGPPTAPLPTPPYNDSRSYASVSSNLTGEDFVALLIGEASGNYNPATHPRGTGAGGRMSDVSEDSEAAAKPIIVTVQPVVATAVKEIVIPVSVDGARGKEIISYEFNVRYDPAVIRPLEKPVDVAGTVSRGLSVVTNAIEPGLLRVVVYGPMPIDADGVLLNLKFTAVGQPGSLSPLTFERIMFNDGEPRVSVSDGRIELF